MEKYLVSIKYTTLRVKQINEKETGLISVFIQEKEMKRELDLRVSTILPDLAFKP